MSTRNEVHSGQDILVQDFCQAHGVVENVIGQPGNAVLKGEEIGRGPLPEVHIHQHHSLSCIGKAGRHIGGKEGLTGRYRERCRGNHRMLAAFRTHIIQVGAQKTHSFREHLGFGVLVGRGERGVAFLALLFPGVRNIGKERHCGTFFHIFA